MNTDFSPAEDEAILRIAFQSCDNLTDVKFWNKIQFPNRDGPSLLRRYLLLNTPIKKK